MKTRDPFPVDAPPETRHLRHRYAPIVVDPIEQDLARLEAQREQAKRDVEQKQAKGKSLDPDPADLRGIPCIARGVGGTSPGSDPLRETERRLDNTRRASLAA